MPLDLNYHHLYYFWSCARIGSLTAAGRELHLSQSALSVQLKSLERSLGRRLHIPGLRPRRQSRPFCLQLHSTRSGESSF